MPHSKLSPGRTDCNGICGPDKELSAYLFNFLGEEWLRGSRDDHKFPVDLQRQIVGCSCQNIEMMELFEIYGVSFSPDKVPGYQDGFNYLHQAASGLYARTLEFLLSRGWNPNEGARQHLKLCSREHGLATEFQSNWFRAIEIPIPDGQFLITPLLECLIQCRVQDFGLDDSDWSTVSDITISKKQERLIEKIWAAADVLIKAGATLDCDGLSPVKFWLPAELSNLKGNQDLEVSRRMLLEYSKRGGSFRWALVERGFRNDTAIHRFTEYDSEIRRFAPSLIQDIVRILARAPETDLEGPREWWKAYQEGGFVDHQTPLCKMVIQYLRSRSPEPDAIYMNSEAGKHHLACLKILVEAGASTEVLTIQRHSLVHVVAAFRCEEVLEILCRDRALVRHWMFDEEAWKNLFIGTREEVVEVYTNFVSSSQSWNVSQGSLTQAETDDSSPENASEDYPVEPEALVSHLWYGEDWQYYH